MNPFEIIGKWFWAVSIVFTFANAASFRRRAAKHIEANPELADGYRRIIRGFVIWSNIPWIIMGIGCLSGGAPSIFHFFRPRDGNPFVLAFFASIFLIWVLGTYWLFVRGGAEMLIKHPGLINCKNAAMLKLFWLLALAGGILAVVMMLTHDTPVTWPPPKS